MLYNTNNLPVHLSLGAKSFINCRKKMAKKRRMSKTETLFRCAILPILISLPLHGEIEGALLTSVESNAAVRLLYQNISFRCEPFGVIPLEMMAQDAPDPQECRSRIEQFHRSHPRASHFAAEHLHVQQTYRFERMKEGCVLYANGPESFSEMLLKEGLAQVHPVFDNKEWNAKLQRAQRGAQMHNKGLYQSDIRKYCIKEEE